MLFDAHFHYPVCKINNVLDEKNIDYSSYKALSCSHSLEEWEIQSSSPKNVLHSFGIHPQIIGCLSKDELNEYKKIMKQLAQEGKLDAIGEAGFDLFTEEFKNTKELQEEIFLYEVKLCQEFMLPIVIHCRKANDKLFQYSKELKKIPSVLFHSFMGSLVEANSLINRGINCYFSFGKQMINNNKKVMDCVINLPINHLLLETDAPFQTLKGEKYTLSSEIKRVYTEAYSLRRRNSSFSMKENEFQNAIYENSKNFLLH